MAYQSKGPQLKYEMVKGSVHDIQSNCRSINITVKIFKGEVCNFAAQRIVQFGTLKAVEKIWIRSETFLAVKITLT